MDPVTHAVLGMVAGLATARKGVNARHAALAGFAAGLLPDIDIFIRERGDPLAIFRWHRHFTHSFAFSPVLAATAAGLAWLVLIRRRPRFSDLLVPALAGVVSHLLLDAGTTYGTLLGWPFSRARVSWDFLPIIDPVFVTLPLLVLAVVAVARRSRGVAIAGLAWMALYSGFALDRHARALDALRAHAEAQGRRPARWMAAAAPLSPMLWRGLYESEGRIYAVAVRPGFGGTKLWPGESVAVFPEDDPAMPMSGSVAAGMVAELRRFSSGWLSASRLPDGRIVVGDARFSILPQGAEPLWGIVLRPGRDTEPPSAFMGRRGADAPYRTFFGMLFDNADAPETTKVPTSRTK